ncbi:MAG: InlB B-repeat-containing protein, partial [Treponema sp.]|nr:InlB B-repeat-containing protein [Treponema sp.]
MKTWKHFTFAAFLVIFVILAFITCDTGNNGSETYTVTFDSDGGTSITAQTVAENGRVTEPAAPTKENNIAGLYMGTPDDYTFAGWYNGDTKWDFNAPVTANISLKAKWVSPAPAVDISTSYGNNIFDKAFSYLNGNEGIYTLLLDEDVETEGTGLIGNTSYSSGTTIANLTITGIGEERTITPQGYESGGNTYYNSIFDLMGEGNILTIGKHITLKGANDETVIEKSPLVHIEDGVHFIMLPVSKITGHTSTSNSSHDSGVINIGSWYLSHGYFTMEGGEISGNNTTYCIALWEG